MGIGGLGKTGQSGAQMSRPRMKAAAVSCRNKGMGSPQDWQVSWARDAPRRGCGVWVRKRMLHPPTNILFKKLMCNKPYGALLVEERPGKACVRRAGRGAPRHFGARSRGAPVAARQSTGPGAIGARPGTATPAGPPARQQRGRERGMHRALCTEPMPGHLPGRHARQRRTPGTSAITSTPRHVHPPEQGPRGRAGRRTVWLIAC